ncbi:DUF3667 domain-containing protein [Pedobacter sp. HMF7647]|uniref:DUF3667 domain-containing protein n=1 Tax=Hufsiella arboris TaxID=2695275 RepID=A0A7K1Y9L6_9SPHI|nr:DUF3667 domain-containing protein [Hufsiella arboris]MXV51275.1 DUF3667 domain-containing protein [Hufsiella arboris]
MNCNNCGDDNNGVYCISCGQKLSVGRLSMHELTHETWHAFTHMDKGMIRLVSDLIVRPAIAYADYFSGKRKTYFSPVLFFILTAGILAVLYPYVFDFEDKVVHMNNQYGRELYHLTKYRAILLLPLETLLTWLAFRKRFNFAEIVVFWLFALGLTYFFRLILLPVYFPLIEYKSNVDLAFQLISYAIILWQGIALFGRSAYSVIALILILNVMNLADLVLQLYTIFDIHIFNNNVGIHSWWDILKYSYGIS